MAHHLYVYPLDLNAAMYVVSVYDRACCANRQIPKIYGFIK